MNPGRVMASRCMRMALCRQTPLPAVHLSSPQGPSYQRLPYQATPRAACSSVASASTDVRPTSGIALYNEDVEVYDRVFSDRNFEEEAEFLVEAFVKHSGQKPKSSLEIGCGPGRHSGLLAMRWGLRSHALDNSASMLSFARKQAAAADAEVGFIEADMRSHVLREEQQVDLAFMLCGTMSHLLTNVDALGCFESAARSLRSKGCLILEMVHPEDLFGGSLELGTVWDIAATPDHPALSVAYGSEGDIFDPLTQVIERTVEVTEWTDKDGDHQKELLTDKVPQRFFTSQEVDLLARASGLEVVGTYGNLSLPFCTIADEETFALVMVLRKL